MAILVKVTCNRYGNYRGFVSGQGWKALGCNEYDATAWASDALDNNPGSVLSLQSEIRWSQIDRYRLLNK